MAPLLFKRRREEPYPDPELAESTGTVGSKGDGKSSDSGKQLDSPEHESELNSRLPLDTLQRAEPYPNAESSDDAPDVSYRRSWKQPDSKKQLNLSGAET